MITSKHTSQNAAEEKNSRPSLHADLAPTDEGVSPLVAADSPASPPAAPASALRVILYGFLTGLVLSIIILFTAPALREWVFAILPESQFSLETRTMDIAKLKREIQQAERRLSSLQRKMNALIPRQPYLIVNSSGNRIYVMSGNKLIHEGLCSTGSYVLLKAQDDRQWIFSTPRGMFRIQGKIKNPVWRMPDWAFIEEGRPVPPPNSPERFEAGVLGDYALSFGNGYLVHGTLYQRLLGMPVTHGCVRLGDEDLRIVYQNLELGSKVFIY
ncbi:L,D-transpeptidase [candidate division KSB1 bacterium]|nr:L,D-transpeptidase [candidate division KSB1 bacterium]